MIRLDRRRLDTATFPDWQQIATRYGDLDIQGHVNNVAVLGLFQEARALFHKGTFTILRKGGRNVVVGSVLLDYAGEMFAPEIVEIGTGILEIGRTSFSVGQIARQRGRVAAYAETTLVLVEEGVPTPVEGEAREFLERTLLVPAV